MKYAVLWDSQPVCYVDNLFDGGDILFDRIKLANEGGYFAIFDKELLILFST